MDRGGDGLFRSTAGAYARYQPGYPQPLFALLVERFGLDGSGRLLDLGCGTGQLTLPLARHVGEAVGVDPEAEMLAEAAAAARRRGVGNASWILGASGVLDVLGPRLGRFRLVTMGRSFHWMDGAATLRALAGLVEPGGGIAIVEEDRANAPRRPWQEAVAGVVERWQGEAIRAEARRTYAQPKERHPELVAGSPFRGLETHLLADRRRWDVDGIVGYLASTTYGSAAALGARRRPFERDLRETLRRVQPDEEYVEDGRLRVLLAWQA